MNETRRDCGFTIPELLVAGVLLIILSVGSLEVFVSAIRINGGNNLRMQALSVLQQEVEYYRSLSFVPGLHTPANLSTHRRPEMMAGTHTRPNRTSADGIVFSITATVTNVYSDEHETPPTLTEAHVAYKQIEIVATPVATQPGWLQNLNTRVVVQRVRAN